MKLTAKRDRWYFWRELFSYMIPMILIVGTVDVFYNFMQCPLHPEWSAPCNIIRINAAGYGLFLIIAIIFAAFSAKKLRKVKKRIETEFLKVTNSNKQSEENTEDKATEKIEEAVEKVAPEKKVKPKKIIAKSSSATKEKSATKKTTTKKKVAKK